MVWGEWMGGVVAASYLKMRLIIYRRSERSFEGWRPPNGRALTAEMESQYTNGGSNVDDQTGLMLLPSKHSKFLVCLTNLICSTRPIGGNDVAGWGHSIAQRLKKHWHPRQQQEGFCPHGLKRVVLRMGHAMAGSAYNALTEYIRPVDALKKPLEILIWVIPTLS